MAYTETKTTGYGQRVGNSIKNVLVGIALFLGATGMLWWNEGSFVKTRAALHEAHSVTVELGDIDTPPDGSKDGKLVHATGPAETRDILKDDIFGISVTAIRLERAVEYFQWVENKSKSKKTNTGGSETETTTYTYKQEWTDKPVNSSEFADSDAHTRNKNSVLIKLDDLTVQATNVTFGAYSLPKFLINSIHGAESLNADLSDDVQAKLNQQISPTPPPTDPSAAANPEAEATTPPEPPRMVHPSGNKVYLGRSPDTPAIGDVRVTFTKVPPATVSLLAKLNGKTFEEYIASNGKTVSRLSVGTHSLENMYATAHAENSMLTWILRGAGILGVCIGLALVMAPLQVLASIIPFLGRIIGAGSGLFGLLAGLAWSFLIIALAWLFYRPLIGLLILAVSASCVWLLVSKVRAWKNARAQQPVENRVS